MKIKIVSIVTVATVTAIGYIVSHPVIFHLCSNTYQFNNYIGCLDESIKNFGEPLFTFSLWVLLSVIVGSFFSDRIFRPWLRFTAWAVPLAIIFIATTPVNFTGIGMNFFPFYRDDAARLAGLVFAVTSLILIVWKHFSLRHNSN